MSSHLRLLLACPACDTSTASARRLFALKLLGEPCTVIKCGCCGLVYKELCPTSAGLEQIYSSDYTHFGVSDRERNRADEMSAEQKFARCECLLKRDPKSSKLRLLDIGCGSGAFVDMARDRGYDATGIDPFLPTSLQSEYLRRADPQEIETESYDVALALNVAEHLTDPRGMFAAVHSLLRPKGVVLLTSPFGDSLARRRYKARWIHMVLDEHLLFWTPRSLTRLLRHLNFAGPISQRISGSPFPFGRTIEAVAVSRGNEWNGGDLMPAGSTTRLQDRVWRLARRLQRRESLANAVRTLVHVTRSGDYMEFAIAKNN